MTGLRCSSRAVAAIGMLLVTACGTRLPDTDFVQSQQQVGVPGSVTPGGSSGSGGAVPGAGGPAGRGGVAAGSGGSVSGPGTGSTGPASGGGNAPGAARSGGASNTASDVGVTPTTITIGNIVSKTNPFDPRAFVGPAYGLQAFVNWTNAHGGINGRKLVLKTCDDQGSGDQDVSCVHQLVDADKVFALVSNAVLDYSGGDYVNSKAVPDIGSQPIDTRYDKYPHLWDIYGENYPRDGKQVGFGGKLYGGTEVYHYFKVHFPKVPKVAGVVEYNQDASQRFGDSIVAGLQKEGYKVIKKVVNFALPDYDSVAIDFKNNNVQYVYDTIDRGGNVRLCKALDDNQVNFTAKVVTTQSWEQSVASDYRSSPRCRNKMWATGNTQNYEDTKYPEVADFRQQMASDGHGSANDLSDWALEGWAGGLWFADAAASCGGDLTRKCVETFMNRKQLYDGHGLLTPRKFEELAKPPTTSVNCINVARWQDSAHGWVTQVPDMDKNCFRVPQLPYSP